LRPIATLDGEQCVEVLHRFDGDRRDVEPRQVEERAPRTDAFRDPGSTSITAMIDLRAKFSQPGHTIGIVELWRITR
jgi:hypothetical protein